jgi:glutamyl-tRNA synthetase
LLLDFDGTPLSKRLGSLSLESLRKDGIEPMAINSLLARLGTSKPIEPTINLDDLAADFSLSHFSRTPPHFNFQDLETLTRKIYQMMPFETIEHRLESFEGIDITQMPEALWLLVRGNIKHLDELLHWQQVCYGDIVSVVSDPEYLNLALELLPTEPWNETTWETWTARLKQKTGRKGKDLFMPLRQAITGFDHGPEMKGLLLLIGPDKVKQRLGKR